MMSARDVAVAALSGVIANRLSESPESQLRGAALPRSTNNIAVTSMQDDVSKDANAAHSEEANASVALQSNSSSNSQETASTPATSEDFSQSQESHSQLSQLSQHTLSTAPISQDVGTAPPVLSIATNAGQKRTHDGFTKPPDSSSSTSPPLESIGKHSRNTSTASAASSRELVSDLRTRLSYAMTKVNKGWESLPMDEVESLTSQTASPSSSNSTIHGRRNVFTSPRTAIASLQDQFQDSSHYSNIATASSSQRDPILFSDSQTLRTYESFWREQSQRHSGTPSNLTSPASSQPTLAPPADITSAVRQSLHRSETPKFSKPPILAGQIASELSQSGHFSAISMPRTPNRHSQVSDVILQTPSQKSIQEREAIETLMFMGSPGNPTSLPHPFSPRGSQQQSPLRVEFDTALRGTQGRSEFPIVGSTDIALSGTRRGRYGARPLLGEDLDRMLDMPDESSDEEIEIPITPRRLAAGRV